MSEEKRFDELLSSKLSEREFPFDELNWDEAERLIIQQQKWSTIRRFSLVFSAGLALGVLIMLPFLFKSSASLPNQVASKLSGATNTSDKNTTTSVKPITNNANSNPDQANTEKSSLPVQSAFVKKNKGTGAQSATPQGLSPIANVPKGRPLLAKGDGGTTKSHHHKKTNPSIVAFENNSAKKSNSTEKVTTISSQQIENSSNQPQTTIASVITPIKEDQNKPVSSNTIINSTAPTNPETSKTTLPNVSSVSKPGDTAISKFVIAKNNTQKTLPKPDSNNGGLPMLRTTNFIKDATITFLPKNSLSVDAGANYSFGWNNGTKEANGITPWGGVTFTHAFSNNIAASAGVDYTELNHLNKTYTSSVMQYDFGASSKITTVTPQTIYYLAIPINFQYNINDKFRLSAGLDYLWMLTTSSTVNTYQKDYLGQQTETSSRSQNGYTQGFANYDFQFTIKPSMMLTERFGISIEYYYGLVYVENNSFPGINQYERNSGIRFFLSYTVLK